MILLGLIALAILLFTLFLSSMKLWIWNRELGRIVTQLEAAAKNLETLHAENLKLEAEAAGLVLEISKRLEARDANRVTAVNDRLRP